VSITPTINFLPMSMTSVIKQCFQNSTNMFKVHWSKIKT
jgi:hypothetical protein